MDAKMYTEILQKSLLQTLRDHRINKRHSYFQQDNDPKHRSKMATMWFKRNKIRVLDWASSSPDMNIIEQVWSYLDTMMHSREVQPRNKEEFWEALQEEWYWILNTYISKLYQSMPSRVLALKKAKGGHTKY